jgi:hypothetical protein
MVSERDNRAERVSQVSDLVGREGVEPSTKRLRAATSNADAFRLKYLQLPLSLTFPDSGPIRPDLADLRGQLERGDLLFYSRAEGDSRATYLGRYGSRHAILIRAHGAHGRKLRYVADGEITPSIPTASNP